MLSYQHGYHAGNPADVHKHLTLIGVLQRMQAKASAIHYFDTHAGKGHYDLQDAQAQKKAEYATGIAQVLPLREQLEAAPFWADYFAVIDTLQQEQTANPWRSISAPQELRYYPGSPAWVGHFARAQDRHTVFELHPTEHAELDARAQTSKQQKLGRVVHGDGLAGVVQQLPPKTPRLMVLIDPAYENKGEYRSVADTVALILQRCRHAVVLVWYPLLPAQKHQELLAAVQSEVTLPVLQSEFCYRPQTGEFGMYGAGMLVVNPPWQFEQQLAAAMQPLLPSYGSAARFEQRWLVAEGA